MKVGVEYDVKAKERGRKGAQRAMESSYQMRPCIFMVDM